MMFGTLRSEFSMYRSDEATSHDAIVAAVATRKLKSSKRPELRTYSNPDKQRNMGIFDRGRLVYPDVVVVNTQVDRADKIGEIETPHTINERSAKQWQAYSRLAPEFFLYVPAGFEREALRLLNDYNIRFSGLRIYIKQNSRIIFADVEVTEGRPHSILEIRPRPPPEPPIRPKPEQDR
jgi:hypothetical protein